MWLLHKKRFRTKAQVTAIFEEFSVSSSVFVRKASALQEVSGRIKAFKIFLNLIELQLIFYELFNVQGSTIPHKPKVDTWFNDKTGLNLLVDIPKKILAAIFFTRI